MGGNIEKAAEILVSDGALPSITHNCCYSIPSNELATAAQYMIQDYTIIITDSDSRADPQNLIAVMKQYLLLKEPIICAIRQTETFQANRNLYYSIGEEVDANNDYKKSNHAICVVGFDDRRDGGSLLIKNNYRTFGSYGFTWITYNDFMKYLTYALVLGDFVSDTLPLPVKYDPSDINGW